MKRSNLYLLLCFALVAACNNPSADPETPTVVPAEKFKVANGPVAIDYEDSKSGDTTLVFVHG